MQIYRALCASLLACLTVRGDEGMWTFDNPPLPRIQESYHFTPDAKWLDHARLAAVEFGSASGAFVSKDGLVLTNHHVGLRHIEKVSEPGDKDYAHLGFIARTRPEEIQIPGLKLYTLMGSVNVTDKVNAAVKPGMDAHQAMNARMERLAKLSDDLNRKDGLLADGVGLFKGGEYWIYRYKVHRDVRLVMAPDAQIAFYGGDPENWTYPRHDLDFALFRVYEGGAPYHPPHYLNWSREGVKAGDLVFVVGKPASTQRLNTLAQMRYERDVKLPAWIREDEQRRAALLEYGQASPAKARTVASDLFSTENNLKADRGAREGLLDGAAFAGLEKAEQDLRAAVEGRPELKAEAGDSWDRIEEALVQLKPLDELACLVNSFRSKLLKAALETVRCAQELDRPAAERLKRYRAADDADYEKWRLEHELVFSDMDVETFLIGKGLKDIQERLGPEHPFRKAVLGDRDPVELARDLVSGTKLNMIYVRTGIIQQRAKGVSRSQDPMVRLARAIEGTAREIDQKRQALDDVIQEHIGRIARARFALHGNTLSPDATGTMRLSYGSVAGYAEGGRQIEPFTDFAGLYEKAARMGLDAGNGAWALPELWRARKERLDLKTPLNFCHTADVSGGNSGSATIDRRGAFVGVLFDGNLQSLPGTYYYDGAMNRSVSLDSRAILEALVKVYDAKFLVDELTFE